MGGQTDLRVEFARRVLGSEYRLNPADGENSRRFISRVSTNEHRLTFDGTAVGYINMDGSFRVSENKKYSKTVTEFKRMYEKALKEHKEKIGSVVEEETGGGILEESMVDIF
jgi:acetylornithine/succinyldiaminopimelate/putrescine aminotransferase